GKVTAEGSGPWRGWEGHLGGQTPPPW
ncbi:unnamed protein product, partial [Tetraodon nigroviridis]